MSAAAKSTQRWADKSGRKQIQVYLPRRYHDMLTNLKSAREMTDKLSGQKRSISYADVIVMLLDRDSGLWLDIIDKGHESFDKVMEACTFYEDKYEESLSEATSLREANEYLTDEIERVKVQNNVDTYKKAAAENAQFVLKQAEKIKTLEAQLDGYRKS